MEQETYDREIMERVFKKTREAVEKGWCQDYSAIKGTGNYEKPGMNITFVDDLLPCSEKDRDAQYWCLFGAVHRAVYLNLSHIPHELEIHSLYYSKVFELLSNVLPEDERNDLINRSPNIKDSPHMLHRLMTRWNDVPGRTKENVLFLLKEAEILFEEESAQRAHRHVAYGQGWTF